MTQEQQPAVMVDDGSGNPVDRKNLRTAAWGGLIGTALEQYDFVIYGTATAIVFNRIFFPSVEPTVGVIAGFATYAVGFLARPLGGLFFSRYGDRLGRKFVLLTEVAPQAQRGRYASLVFVGASAGTALGAVAWILVQLLPDEQVLSWGWRLVFFSSVFVTVAAYVLRRRAARRTRLRAGEA